MVVGGWLGVGVCYGSHFKFLFFWCLAEGLSMNILFWNTLNFKMFFWGEKSGICNYYVSLLKKVKGKMEKKTHQKRLKLE